MRDYDLIIVGGGASGILCAIEADKFKIGNILLIEKDPILGGALTSADYNISKNKEITGIEYKKDLLNILDKCSNVEIQLSTMVLKIEENNEVICTSEKNGIEKIKGSNIILCNGAKEGSRKAISMVGDRCSGIYTLGMAKKIFNIENMVPGKNILIDGNETLYMLEKEIKEHDVNIVGIVVHGENKESYGLTDNIYEGYEITQIVGNGRLENIVLSKEGKNINIDCDTLIFAKSLISDGLVAMRSGINLNPTTTGPVVDNDFMTSRDSIYACGNGIYIHGNIEEIEVECRSLVLNIKNK